MSCRARRSASAARLSFCTTCASASGQDLVAQLEDASREIDLTLNDVPGQVREIHAALLSGLLSHLGTKDGGPREYTGARGAKFALFPGSALARRGPSWVMVAELVETTRLWGRTARGVYVKRVEPLAEHLVKRSATGEPRGGIDVAPLWSRPSA